MPPVPDGLARPVLFGTGTDRIRRPNLKTSSFSPRTINCFSHASTFPLRSAGGLWGTASVGRLVRGINDAPMSQFTKLGRSVSGLRLFLWPGRVRPGYEQPETQSG